LNPLDSQHHLRITNEFLYREGIVTNKQHPKGSFVNVGLLNDILVDKQLPEGLRVTVKIPQESDLKSKKLKGKIVSPSEPRQRTGIYWGYNVRIANSISQVFSQSPYEDGYDITIGTSDKGESVYSVESKSLKFKHMLIVFGGLLGLENAVENDENLTVDDPSLLFDKYFNVVPQQGSRTIRTEEAVLITLAALSEKIEPSDPPPEFILKDLIAQSEDTGHNQQQFSEPMKRKNKNKNKDKVKVTSDGSAAEELDLSRFD
jgi:predicted SPOUT superfamily RNA methylase MTH1